MERRSLLRSLSAAGAALLPGCQTKAELQSGALTPSASATSQRVLQTRRFDTQDEAALLQSTIAVLQDLGFAIEESRAEAGLVTGTKRRDATESGQVAAQLALAFLAAAARTQHRVVMDRDQLIRVQVVVRPTQNRTGSLARVTFQRIVFNTDNQVSQMQTLEEPELYQAFFEQLSKSSFLAAHDI